MVMTCYVVVPFGRVEDDNLVPLEGWRPRAEMPPGGAQPDGRPGLPSRVLEHRARDAHDAWRRAFKAMAGL